MLYHDVSDYLLALLPPKSRLLDLGAGPKALQSVRFAAAGHRVVAIDQNPAQIDIVNFDWRTADIGDWLQRAAGNELFDAVLARNSLQFNAADRVTKIIAPCIDSVLKPGGLVAMQSFFQPPDPPFAPDRIMSYWKAEKLVDLFQGYDIISARDVVTNRPDMRGVMRRFSLSEALLKNP